MKFGQFQALEVTIFDQQGNLITELYTLKNSYLQIKDKHGYLFIKDALLDKKFLEFIGKVEEDNSTDFDKFIKNKKYSTTITFNNRPNKVCKIIGKGVLRNATDFKDNEFLFEIPDAIYDGNIDFISDMEQVSEFDFAFRILPNDNGDLFKMHI
jgi:hypothetical protein